MPSRSSAPSPATAAGATPAPSPPRSSAASATSEGDRALFWGQKYRNYALFVQSLADYLPAAQPWATSLRALPLLAFKLQVETFFGDAIEKHRAGDNHGRDVAASAVVREQARAHGLELSKLRADDMVKLLRYASLFSLLVAEDNTA